MVKLEAFGAFLIGLLAVAQATRFTVTTTITEQQQEETGQCMEQIRPQISRLRWCQQYLIPEMPYHMRETSKEEEKYHCCEGLKRISDEQCRCEAMSAALKDVKPTMEKIFEKIPGQQESQMEKAMESIRQAAEYLPSRCKIGGPQKYCQIQQPHLIRMVMA